MEFDHHLRSFSGSIVVDAEEEDDEQVEEWLLEQELEKEGLYRGSYRRLLTLYTIVPTTTIVAFGLLALLPLVAYPLDPHAPHSPYPYAPSLPYPLPEMLTAAALWSMSLLLRDFIFSLSNTLSSVLPTYASIALSLAATVIQTLITVVLQVAAVVLLLITPSPGFSHPTWHDHAFRRVWTIALAWAGAEAIVGVKQGYENIALYRDVLVNVKRITPESSPGSPTAGGSLYPNDDISPVPSRAPTRRLSMELLSDDSNFIHRTNSQQSGERQPLLPPNTPQANGTYRFTRRDAEAEVQNDLEQLAALKAREELEEIYGIPVIHIPVFISCLHRINAVLNSLGTFLLLSAAYLRSPLAPPIPEHKHDLLLFKSLLVNVAAKYEPRTLLGLTVTVVLGCQIGLALLHTAWSLPRIGVPTYVYIGLLVSLSLFFAGLAFWEALV